MIKTVFLLLPISALLISCSSAKNKDKEPEKSSIFSDKPTEVKAKLIDYELFNFELVSNGAITANKKTDLKFTSSDVVTSIYVKNGDHVVEGQKIASLNTFKLRNSLEQTKDNMDRAKLELQDILIGQGYSLKEQNAIPEEVLKIAKLKSNFDQCRISFELAEYNLKAATLISPINGLVANLFTKENNVPDGSVPFCTIIDIQQPEVVFRILENELSLIRKNDEVFVSPFSDNNLICKGKIREINPAIDFNGMVRLTASVNNIQNKFYDGMNVRVRVRRAVDKQLLIPKSALVLRNGRKVVFTSRSGKAKWNYVQTSLENSESYVVTEGLQKGDSVIFDGNINLADESPIVLR